MSQWLQWMDESVVERKILDLSFITDFIFALYCLIDITLRNCNHNSQCGFFSGEVAFFLNKGTLSPIIEYFFFAE